jgi:type III secretory pathway component EscT
MKFDLTPLNAIAQQIEQVCMTLVKIAVPVAILFVACDILVGTNFGVAQRLTALLSMSVKEVLGWSLVVWFVINSSKKQ